MLEFRLLRGLAHVTPPKKILSCEYNSVTSLPRKIWQGWQEMVSTINFIDQMGFICQKQILRGRRLLLCKAGPLVMCGLLALTTWQQTEDLLYLTQRLERNHFHIFLLMYDKIGGGWSQWHWTWMNDTVPFIRSKCSHAYRNVWPEIWASSHKRWGWGCVASPVLEKITHKSGRVDKIRYRPSTVKQEKMNWPLPQTFLLV